MVVLTQPHELTWGAIALDSENETEDPWRYETLGLDATLGSPVPVVEVIESLIDGDLSVISSYGNREATFVVRVSALDGESLAQGEARLMSQALAERPAELRFVPPTIGSWPAVFDVVTVRLDPSFDPEWDFEETTRACRYYTLTFECLPWARAPETSIIPAVPAPEDPEDPPTPVLVDACSSTAGWVRRWYPSSGAWSSMTGPTVVLGDRLRITGTVKPGIGNAWIWFERTGHVDMTGTPYLVVNAYASAGIEGMVTARFDGAPSAVAPVAIIPISGSGGVSSYYFAAPADFDELEFRLRIDTLQLSGRSRSYTFEVHEVARISSIPTPDPSGFQVARTAIVGGTAPTQAALRFATTLEGEPGTDELMHRTAMVYTGANPAISLRPVRHSSSSVSPSSTAVSGWENTLAAPTVFLIPVGELVEANYSLLARLQLDDPRTVTWSARVVAEDGATIPGSEVVETGTMAISGPGALEWAIYELGVIPMPILAGLDSDSTHAVELSLSVASGGSFVSIDEAWVMDTDNGAVTVLNTTYATGPYKIELRSPQLDSPRLAVIGSWQEHGSQDISRLVTRLGTHLFRPGLLHVLTVADGFRYAPCELEYFERFHTFPGPPLAEMDGGS